MAKGEVTRKLAAILAADVAGYSRLMAGNERATIATLNDLRAVFRARIEANRGRVVDMAGDSVLAVFDSVIGAVQAALEAQAEVAKRNDSLPDERRMLYRVGVNLGDIQEHDDGTVYGDGVNVAARLESVAEPGGVTISDPVRQLIKGKLTVELDDLGEHLVKNIAEPVRIYAVARGAMTPGVELRMSTRQDKPSIAVLPFDNMSGDPEQDYFSDGISEDIITDLSKVSGLLIIARNSTFAYKGRRPTIQQVSRDLGAAYVLEGSVRKAGGRVRINAQLIVGRTGRHLWADRYDRDLDDIFEVQDDVTRQIVDALKVRLTETERQALTDKGTSNLDAYDFYLRAREAYHKFSSKGNLDARAWLDKASALDPRFPYAVALLAQTHITDYLNQWGEDWEESRRIGRELALKAVSIDDRCAYAHATLGVAQLWSRELDRAIDELERAIALDPNFAPGYLMLAMALHYAGDSRTALTHIATAKRLDPFRPNFVLHQEALCHFMLGDYGTAAKVLCERIAHFPNTDISRALLTSTYGHLGSLELARSTWSELMQVNPAYSFAQRRKVLPYRNPEDLERIAEGLRKAGLDVLQETN